MIELKIFLKPQSSKEGLEFTFDNVAESEAIKRLLRNGPDRVTYSANSIFAEIKRKTI